MGLEDLVKLILSPDGLAIVVSFVVTTLLPDLLGKNFEDLVPPRYRRLCVLGFAAVISAAALVVARLSLGWVLDETLIWSAVVAIFAVYTGQSLVNSRKLSTTTRWRARGVKGSADELMTWKG